MAAALELRDMHAAYGRIEVLHGVDLVVPEASVFALLGPSGAGKTTTLKTVDGRLRPTRGCVHVADTHVYVSPGMTPEAQGADLAEIRAAIRDSAKLYIAYADEQGRRTNRVIWPIAMAYYVDATLVDGIDSTSNPNATALSCSAIYGNTPITAIPVINIAIG